MVVRKIIFDDSISLKRNKRISLRIWVFETLEGHNQFFKDFLLSVKQPKFTLSHKTFC